MARCHLCFQIAERYRKVNNGAQRTMSSIESMIQLCI